MQTVDLILAHATQLVTCACHNQPKRGAQMRELGLISDGALVVHDGRIVAVGKTGDLLGAYHAEQVVDLSGRVVLPGLVDCHTHVPHAGHRYDEFELRLQGKSYLDILKAGGGILNTVRATRSASATELMKQARKRLSTMLRWGTTTAELKSGYGLSTEAESKQLQAVFALDHAMTLIPTFLGAHAKPEEFASASDYLAYVLADSLPSVHALYQASDLPQQGIPMFVDIFVEEGTFTLEHMVAYFEQARQLGLPRKAHLDQFHHGGAVPVAVEMGATSVDHLEVTPPSDLDILARSETVGVMLPTVNLHLGNLHFANARHLVDADGILALATDYNPGSSPVLSLPFVMALACRVQRLIPSEALNACTVNAAHALGVLDRVGSLEVGKQADVVVLQTDDYRSLVVEMGNSLVEQVYLKGKPQWSASF